MVWGRVRPADDPETQVPGPSFQEVDAHGGWDILSRDGPGGGGEGVQALHPEPRKQKFEDQVIVSQRIPQEDF